jgi:glutathione-independent formaldehyde dehydrogenase
MNEKAKPSFVVSNHYHIDEAPDAYREFDKCDEVVKPVMQFN